MQTFVERLRAYYPDLTIIRGRAAHRNGRREAWIVSVDGSVYGNRPRGGYGGVQPDTVRPQTRGSRAQTVCGSCGC